MFRFLAEAYVDSLDENEDDLEDEDDETDIVTDTTDENPLTNSRSIEYPMKQAMLPNIASTSKNLPLS